MDNSLIVWFNRGGVVKNDDLSFEIIDGFGVDRFIKENHTFSEARTFKSIFFDHTFDGEANCLSSLSSFNTKSFVMN